MNRLTKFIAAFSIIETIGRHPAIAGVGSLILLGIGGGAAIGILTTPTLLPQVSANFNPSNNSGNTVNGLRLNNNTAGALAMPVGNSVTGYTGSFGLYFEATVNPNLGSGNQGTEIPFSGLTLTTNGSPGQPIFGFQRQANGGLPGAFFWWGTGVYPSSVQAAAGGNNYATGSYPWTASGGNCAREPSGIWRGSGASISILDPGFQCNTTPTFSAATIPDAGAQQTVTSATCASGGAGILVTASVAVSPGLSPGQTYPVSLTGSGGTSLTAANLVATSVSGSGPYTIIGTIAGTCPSPATYTGTINSGVSASYTFPAVGFGGTGITTRNGQHICGMIGEYGDDSAFPGAHFLTMVDERGNALPGAPVLIPYLNQGTANFTGSTTASSATMTVSAMKPYAISSAAWALGSGTLATTGLVTFQVSSNPGFVPGSEFTVSGMLPSSVNGTYVAVTGTSTTQVVGSQLTGPAGVLQAYANPGSITLGSTPQLVSVILPGMVVLGSTAAGSSAPAGSLIMPYQDGGTSGTGGAGTYLLNSTQTNSISGTIFAYDGFYYSAAVNGNPAGGTATVRNSTVPGDFTGLIGALNTASLSNGWGGALGNFAMLYGPFPAQTGGAPSTSGMASICTKQKDIQKYASDNGLKIQSLYRLNDPGIFGDSKYGTITGYLSGASATSGGTATLNVVSTPFGSLALGSGTATAKLTGVGLPVQSSAAATTAATIPLTTSASSTYTVTFPTGVTSFNLGSVGSPVTLAVGAFLPALPLQASTVKGYIDTTAGVSTLHVTSLDDGTTHSGFSSFNGTLGIGLTGSIVPGTGSNGAAIGQGLLTVTGPGGSQPNNAIVGIGEIISDAIACSSGCATPATVLSLGTGVGYNGTYVVDVSQTVASRALYGSGILPGPATTLQTSGTTIGTTFVAGMVLTDQPGSSNLTGSPLRVVGVGTGVLTFVGNYYPPFSAGPVQETLTTIVPGEYIQNPAITKPVKILPGWSACGITGAYPGLLGCYTLSGSPNASNAVGSSGAGVVVLTGTTITDGGAIAPGPALTIRDQGPATTFPLTNVGAKTGTVALSGTYDVPTLGGTPSGIQVLVSNSANGPPLAGCTPCNWGALSGTISGGKWSGTIAGIPGGGPYLVSVRATNGIGYATLPNSVKVGWVFATWGQGQADSIQSGGQTGNNDSYASGLWGFGSFGGGYVYGPANPSGAINTPNVQNYAGDRFSVTGISPVSEGVLAFDQGLTNATGIPTTYLSATRDGLGVGLQTLGNVTQTKTIGLGDGTTTTWCSATKFCSHVDVGSPLVYDYATLTGGWFTGSATGGVLTATTRIGGALEPGMVLNTANAPTLLNCLTNCTSINFSTSTWALSNSLDSVSGVAMRADPVPSMLPAGTTSTPWPNLNLQLGGGQYAFGGFGTPLVKAGTFEIIDTDPATGIAQTVCLDSQVFAYNNTGGNCTGANVSSAFVNYQTGDYQINFSIAPLSGHAITAQWTAIISPESGQSSLTRPQGLDFFGDTTTTPLTGADAALFSKAPGGVNGHIYSGIGTDVQYITNSGGSQAGYQYGALGYSQMVSWLFDTKFPNTIPGASPAVSFITTGQWRSDGPILFSTHQPDVIFEQWAQDAVTSSVFSGTVASSVLTLSADAVGPMWEGEVLGCVTFAGGCTIGPQSGVYITSLTGGAWGKSGSTYALAGASGVSSTGAMQNPVFYSGPGPAFYAGALNDIIVQNQLLGGGGNPGTTGRNPHPDHGFTGARRAASRWAAMVYGANNSNPNADPQIDRVKANVNNGGATACDTGALASPCFDVSTTFKAQHAAAWTTAGLFTITGGIAAHDRPFVVGQQVSCSPTCGSNLVITSLSVPPTQSPVAGAGEVGQTFTFQALPGSGGSLPASSTSGTALGGCSGTSGSGSNCIDIAISTNVSGTFGTAAAIATCGANNVNGNAPIYVQANGKCQDNGIGEIVRTFHIGTNQSPFGSGGAYDDGVDPANGQFNQSAAFTCNIVAAKVVQCVKAPAYSSGVFSSIGEWLTASPTFVSYGDMDLASGRIASLVGYVGGQSFPFSSGGTGYSSGTVAATCPTLESPSGTAPRFDVTAASGVIVNVVPSAATSGNIPVGLGVGAACTLTPPTGSGFNGTGAIAILQAPVEGVGGIATYGTESNTMGMNVYDNSGFPGNPLHSFFQDGPGTGYFEPGLPLRPIGMFQGAQVSG